MSTPEKVLYDCNDGILSGWYTTYGDAANSPVAVGGWMRADMFSTIYGTQTWFCELYGGISAQRHLNKGVWQPWEWINPPMELGVEYRTIERYLGKPVYVMAVDFGAMPNNATKYFNHGIANIAHAISAYGSISDGWSAFTAVGIDSQAGVLAVCSFTTTQIRVWCSADWTDSTCVVVLKYTKTTD